MVFIRPASPDDLGALLELAGDAGVGLTTLPKDRDLLRRRILKSCRSFENIPDRQGGPGGESYLLIMQDAETGRVVGASGIVSKVGGFEPFYAFQIKTEVHDCDVLKVHTEVPYLQLVRDHNGPAEIGSLFLSPDYRGKDNGRLLQLVRFLLLAEHPEAFESRVVSELRGVIDADGHSPFWDAVGRHFFDIDFPQADHLSVVNKKFIADLMPTHSIYIPLLPPAARDVIGKAHSGSLPALKNLESEGFRFCGAVDIFDAGPCVACDRDEIRTVRESRQVAIRDITARELRSPVYMLGTRGPAFRACMASLEFDAEQDGVIISTDCARLLGVKTGDTARVAPLRSQARLPSAEQPIAQSTGEGAD
jgi:arginine N-succinyltransferase